MKINFRNRKAKIFLGVIIFVIGFRLALPYIVLTYVNRVLSNLDGFKGHVEDINIHLIRGAYTIKKLDIERTEGKTAVPYLLCETIDLSVEWKSLFKGAFVGEVIITNAALNFVAEAPNGENNDWREPIRALFPLKINTLQVNNGEVHYRDYTVSPGLDLYMRQINATATNLTNSEKISKTMAAKFVAKGKVMKDGDFNIDMDMNPWADKPTFDMNAKMEKLDARELNDFFEAYGKFDVQEGSVGLYVEAAANNGNVKGYVKPIIENLNILKPREEKPGPIKFVYEAALEGIGELFKNHPNDRVATKVSFSGDLENPDINVWTVVVNVLRNAFIKVLIPGIDHTISKNGENKEQAKEEKKQDKKEKKEREKEEKEK